MKERVRLMTAVFAAMALVFVGFATDYYVDAENGDDANDGLAAGEGYAMESFAALFAKYTITSGDKGHASVRIGSGGMTGTA